MPNVEFHKNQSISCGIIGSLQEVGRFLSKDWQVRRLSDFKKIVLGFWIARYLSSRSKMYTSKKNLYSYRKNLVLLLKFIQVLLMTFLHRQLIWKPVPKTVESQLKKKLISNVFARKNIRLRYTKTFFSDSIFRSLLLISVFLQKKNENFGPGLVEDLVSLSSISLSKLVAFQSIEKFFTHSYFWNRDVNLGVVLRLH